MMELTILLLHSKENGDVGTGLSSVLSSSSHLSIFVPIEF